jgi:hypothetical protein
VLTWALLIEGLQEDWYGKTVFPSMTVKTRERALAAFKFMAETTDGDEVSVHESHMTWIARTVLALGGRYLLRPACSIVGLDNEMVAILDLVTLTKTLGEEFQRRVGGWHPQSEKAALSIEMDGHVVAFVMKNGALEIGATAQRTHRVLPRWLATRLYMGYHSGQEVLEMGRIPWDRSDGRRPDKPEDDMKPVALPEPEARLFSMLFPKLWPSSVPDPDVWPWLVGLEHPRYQGAVKTEEMKAQIDGLSFPWLRL